ncbi:hypothetical protein XH92_35585 [Bradyrhizobium sp. CCBAU 53421]|nr:hypothetical protein XH92_35585 [Bradyrhizobium sp. CCBAU 53421]
MDDEFCRERARTVRELAEQADPFIKKRLLQLAANYERRVGQPETEIALTCWHVGRLSRAA